MSAIKLKDDYFKIDVEAHVAAPLVDMNYFPAVKRYREGVPGLRRAVFGTREIPEWARPEKPAKSFWDDWGAQTCPTEEDVLQAMDENGVDIACRLPESFMNMTLYSDRWTTNGQTAAICEKYPQRFIFEPNVGPIIHRGVKNAIKELEILVKERNAKLVKFYPPEDTYINDPELWPFYKKVDELGIPITIHTGANWPPHGLAKYSQPILLEEVANDFPDLKIIAFHFGWPYHYDLNVIAASRPNVYIGISWMVLWAVSAPRRFAELIGEAIRYVGADRIVWGSDLVYDPEQRLKMSVEGFKRCQIPEDMLEGYGYEPLTEEDRRKIFGLNLARLLNIDPTKRRIGLR